MNSDAGFLGWLNIVMTDETTSSVSGTVCLDSDEVLLIQVKQEYVFRMQIYSEVIKASEVGKYVDMDTVVAYGEKSSGGKTALRYLSVGSCRCDHEHLWEARPSCICWMLSSTALSEGAYITGDNSRRQQAKFRGHYTTSVFASQDSVDIDSVGADYLMNEPTVTMCNSPMG